MENFKMKSSDLNQISNMDSYQEKKKSYRRYLFNDDAKTAPKTPTNDNTIDTPKTVTVPVIFFSQFSFNENGAILGMKTLIKLNNEKAF
jgi:hypothetical protein